MLTLRLYEDVLPASYGQIYLPACPRAIYVHHGGMMIETSTAGRWLGENTAEVSEEELTITCGESETRLWRWELSDAQTPAASGLPSAPRTQTTLKLEAEFALDHHFKWLMRCDQVGFPPGGIALTHVHQGPGIRICKQGEITIDTQGHHYVNGPGQAWFEAGHAPVIAPTTEHEPTTFIRCFLLPRVVKSRSSIRYVNEEDVTRKKSQTYRIFAEHFIELPINAAR